METFKKLKTFPKVINELEYEPTFSDSKAHWEMGWETYKDVKNMA